ncbi:uncharacterized protein LOC113770289 [Coffea eugenioides]|uniref:uncharacterized protein LOC113770289 n=1 Tax=Coffea eugenioides TaxID=49369 RepID=UPI000F60C3FC|nr:uncharacterized protein LOC113770289 [Coffea eugenioides]
MADGTRMKTMEEQLRRQDSRLQGILESITADKQIMEDRLDAVSVELSNKLDAFMVAISQQLSSLNRGNPEKGILGSPEGSHSRNSDIGTREQGERNVRSSFHASAPKLEIPPFRGDNPREWIRRLQRYFHLLHIPIEQWMELTEFHLEGKTEVWYQGFKSTRGNKVDWMEFSGELCKRFGTLGQMDPVEEFNKLQLSTTVLAYQEKFEELLSEVMIRAPLLPENDYISCFLSGLPDELRSMVKTQDPKTLSKAFELARLQENAFEAYHKKHKPLQKSLSAGNTTQTAAQYTMPYTKPVIANAVKKQTPYNFRQITPAELQYRREHRLCYKCEEKFGPGYQCKQKKIHLIVAIEDSPDDLVEGEMIEYQGAQSAKGIEMEIHALTGKMTYNTIKLQGRFKGTPLSILVDGGSTHSFVKGSVAQLHPELVQSIKPFRVRVANGEYLTCNRMIPNMSWEMQGKQFTHDMFVINLEPYDVIIGVDWMAAHSPITFDFKQLNMSFDEKGERILLHGESKETVLKLPSDDAEKEGWSTRIWKHACGLKINEDQVCTVTQLDTGFQHSLGTLLEDYKIVFGEPQSLPPPRNCDHQISLVPNAKPFKLAPYRYPHNQKNEIERQVKDMLSSGIIQLSHSPFASPVLLVKKKDGTWRFCVDYRQLNDLTIKDKFSIPIIDDLLDELYGAKLFSKIDLRAGYHQIRMFLADIPKTAFKTHLGLYELGLYEFTVMPFGLTTAPATFQSLMNHVFEPYLRKFVLVFFDNILVYSPDPDTHLLHLKTVLETLKTHSLFAKLSKCIFGQSQVEYLGHVISGEGVQADP